MPTRRPLQFPPPALRDPGAPEQRMCDCLMPLRLFSPKMGAGMRVERIIFFPLFIAMLAGCAARGGAESDAFPFRLRGANTRFRIILSDRAAAASKEPARELDNLELCYLKADRCTIECFPFGSLLMLGPDDAMALVEDNPLSDLRPDGHDPQGESLLDTIGVISVIGGSVERLPETLAEYIEDPDDNADAAVSLARALLSPQGTNLPGFGRSGHFTVTVQLTDPGRKRLLQALRSKPGSGMMMVGGTLKVGR